MSFVRYKKTIEDGDTVILFLGYDNMLQFTVDKNKTHQTKYGALRHRDILGVEYGSKVQCTKGYAHVLHPTPELWTLNLPHRTQILYSTDISIITLQLDLKPGAVVVESGTGSASLSHALLRTITPGGFLHTFDFHEQRVKKAQEEFMDHGYGGSVTVKHRDVLSEGFDLENVADAVFLDLPAPWDAIPHAKQALRKIGGRICSFSPCIEQVQRACEKLQELGFSEIDTMECLSRTFEVRTINMPMPDLGHAWEPTSGPTSACVTEDRGGSHHHPVIGQIEVGGQWADKKNRKKGKPFQKRKGDRDEASSSKVLKVEDRDDMGKEDSDGTSDCEHGDREHVSTSEDITKDRLSKEPCFDKTTSYVFKSGIAPQQMHGHTGYLTFATLLPE